MSIQKKIILFGGFAVIGGLLIFWFTLSPNKQSLLKCKIEYSEDYRNRCYYTLAMKNNDPDLCRTLPNSARCIMDLIMRNELYKNESNKALCREVGSLQKACEFYFAYQQADNSKSCESITDPFLKDGCFEIDARKTKDPKRCDNLSTADGGHSKALCYLDAGEGNYTMDLCAQIEKTYFTTASECFLRLAIQNNNAEICKRVYSVPELEKCLDAFRLKR